MNRQFKVGDRALTIKAKTYPAMLEVELLAFAKKGQQYSWVDGDIWTAPYDGWVVDREEEKSHDFYRPIELMPLRGDFVPEQTKSREVPE